MFVEQLETRALLSAVVANGVLTVTGTSGDDQITIRTAKDDAGNKILVVVEGVKGADVEPVVTKITDPVTSVVVNAGAGNDSVSLKGNRKHPFSIAATINGEDGNDRLTGGAGADLINGGAGNDRADGGDGNDQINGDAGDDRLDGGAGNDIMNGGDGNDRINAADRGGVDTVDGGAPVGTTTTTTPKRGKKDKGDKPVDGDVAMVDPADVVTNVETIHIVKAKGHGKGHNK
jgi:Ca2+-binding RTX toxin-like protein